MDRDGFQQMARRRNIDGRAAGLDSNYMILRWLSCALGCVALAALDAGAAMLRRAFAVAAREIAE